MKAKNENMGRPPLDPSEPSVRLQCIAPKGIERRVYVYAAAKGLKVSAAVRGLLVQSLERWESDSPELLGTRHHSTLKRTPPLRMAEPTEGKSIQTRGPSGTHKNPVAKMGKA